MGLYVTLKQDTDAASVTTALSRLGLSAEIRRGPGGAVHGLWVPAWPSPDRVRDIAALAGVAEVHGEALGLPGVQGQTGADLRDILGTGHLGPLLVLSLPAALEAVSARRALAVAARASFELVRLDLDTTAGQQARPLIALALAAGMRVAVRIRASADLPELPADTLPWLPGSLLQDFALLREAGELGRPVVLEAAADRDRSEWLGAAEHLLHAGAAGVVFCAVPEPRAGGLDLVGIAGMCHEQRQPLLVDVAATATAGIPVAPLALASLAAGAGGVVLRWQGMSAQLAHPGALDEAALLSLSNRLGARRGPRPAHVTELRAG